MTLPKKTLTLQENLTKNDKEKHYGQTAIHQPDRYWPDGIGNERSLESPAGKDENRQEIQHRALGRHPFRHGARQRVPLELQREGGMAQSSTASRVRTQRRNVARAMPAIDEESTTAHLQRHEDDHANG